MLSSLFQRTQITPIQSF